MQGEDPYLSGEYGVQYVSGLQGGSDGGFLKAASIVKHAFDYDLEGTHGPTDRGGFDAVVSAADQADYFWPPFKAAVSRANASGLMCSYNAVNGVPSCMNAHVNNEVVRREWGMDGLIVSDCGAIADDASSAYIKQNFGGSAEAQAAQGVLGGCDFNCGSYYSAHLASAVSTGALNSTDIDRSASRLLKKALQLGLFDPVETVPYASFGAEKLGSAASAALALEGAIQALVLLKNDPPMPNGTKPLLPLDATVRVALIGPHLNASDDMLSNYRGQNNVVHNHTPLLAISRRGNVVGHAMGSALWDANESGFAAAVTAASAADVAIVFLGLHPQWFDSGDGDAEEGEDNDRANITLSAVQLKLLQAVHATGVPVVVVLISGGQVAIPWAKANVPAIIQAWYPGELGGDAIGAVLYGDASPSGRLPYTFYDDDFTNRRPSIGDMSLSSSGGITYMHYDGTPLWPFGWGLSYTTFLLNWVSESQHKTKLTTLVQAPYPSYTVSVTNIGAVSSDVSVLAFLAAEVGSVAEPAPLRELFAFCRLHAVPPRQSRQCDLAVDPAVVAHHGRIRSGHYAVSVELGDGTSIRGGLEAEP
jgi:beta-glucosidase-like glycosyl hydrolase